MFNISVFASGNGSNAEAIITYFKEHKEIRINAIYSNNPNAFVLQRADKLRIPTHIFTRQQFYESQRVLHQLQNDNTQLIVLAGFMWLVPEYLVNKFTIINIHPALLPAYGGKGMYGHHVHKAVLKNNEKESGITIHYVNNAYDEGDIIQQKSCEVLPNDTPETLANRIHNLEHAYFPETVFRVAKKMIGE